MEILNKKDFEKLIEIQIRNYETAKGKNENCFQMALSELTESEIELAITTDIDLDRVMRRKAQDWLDFEYYADGLTAYKNFFFRGYFRALIPILIRKYIRKGFNGKTFPNFISDDGGELVLSKHLIEKYPFLDEILVISAKSYSRMLTEYEESEIKNKAGYKGDPNSIEKFKGFPKSILVDLMRQICKSKTTLESIKKINKIKYIVSNIDINKENQNEIAKKLGISQPSVSRLLKKYQNENKSKDLNKSCSTEDYI